MMEGYAQADHGVDLAVKPVPALGELDKALDVLAVEVAQFEGSLRPVLLPPSPLTESEGVLLSDAPLRSPLIGSVVEQAERVRAITASLSRLRERVDL